MKLQKLVLPVVALMTMTACSGSGEEVKDGKLPEGGQEVTQREEVEKQLAAAIVNTSEAYAEAKSAGVSLSMKETSVSMKSANIEASFHIDPFEVNAGFNNLSGTKEEFKAGVELDGLKFNANAKYKEETKDFNLELGNIAAYLQNDNLYVNASEAQLSEIAAKLVGFAMGYLSESEEYSAYVPLITVMGLNTATGIDSFLKGMLGKDFNYNFVYDDLGLTYPLVSKVTESVANEEAKAFLNSIEEKTQVGYDKLLKFFTYDGASLGIELSLDKDKATEIASEYLTEHGITLEKCDLSVALCTNNNKVLNSAGFNVDIVAVVDNEENPEAFGGPVTFEIKCGGDLKAEVGKNSVKYPDNYDDYVSVNALVDGAISAIKGYIPGLADDE